MGRKLMRVPLDFDWPQGERWEGYVKPHYKPCGDCKDGMTVARRYLSAITQLLMLVGEGGVSHREMHPWLAVGLTPYPQKPGPDAAELTAGLAERQPSAFGFGHDSVDRWRAERKIIEAAGLDPKKWGICPTCKGEAIDPAVQEQYEAWKPTDPPTGDGYQLWETTSEGSPVSPVFGTLRELCVWCENNATTFGGYRTTADEWERMLADDFVHHKEGNNIFI